MSKNEKTVVIHVDKLHKKFKKQRETKSIKDIVLSAFQAGKSSKRKDGFVAIEDLSFDVHEGEFFGIVGRNGSGKSTLLKILAGVYIPSRGKVDVLRPLTPFIELGVGFNPDLSGKDNVYLNAALLGFSRKETDLIYDEIVEFSELHDFMEEKLRNYSSGMQVRLAFSIAIKAKSDILLIDEVLAVGDTAFQHKCINYFKRIKREGRTVVFVTHDMSSVERFCDRVLVLDKSKFLGVFKPQEASKIYQQINAKGELDSEDDLHQQFNKTGRLADGLFSSVMIGESNQPVMCGTPLKIKIKFNQERLKGKKIKGLIAMSFFDGSGQFVATLDSDKFRYDGVSNEVTMTLQSSPFVSGVYTVYASMYQKEDDEYIIVDAYDAGARFASVSSGGSGSGQLFLHKSEWK